MTDTRVMWCSRRPTLAVPGSGQPALPARFLRSFPLIHASMPIGPHRTSERMPVTGIGVPSFSIGDPAAGGSTCPEYARRRPTSGLTSALRQRLERSRQDGRVAEELGAVIRLGERLGVDPPVHQQHERSDRCTHCDVPLAV